MQEKFQTTCRFLEKCELGFMVVFGLCKINMFGECDPYLEWKVFNAVIASAADDGVGVTKITYLLDGVSDELFNGGYVGHLVEKCCLCVPLLV